MSQLKTSDSETFADGIKIHRFTETRPLLQALDVISHAGFIGEPQRRNGAKAFPPPPHLAALPEPQISVMGALIYLYLRLDHPDYFRGKDELAGLVGVGTGNYASC